MRTGRFSMAAMLFRQLGDIQMPLVGLGTGRLASPGHGATGADAVRLLDTAADLGVNFIDTADSYASGECERRLGELLAGRRDKFLLATKAGYTFADLPGPLRVINPFLKKALHKLGRRQDFSPARIGSCIDASLRRLRTDRVDFFLLHTPDTAAITDELFTVLDKAKSAGKIRHLGISCDNRAAIETASGRPGVTLVQTPVNPHTRQSFTAIAPILQTKNIGIVANQIFQSGRLLSQPGIQTRIQAIASEKRVPLPRLLIQYAVAQPGVTTVLTGTTNAEHLRQNVADALAQPAFTPEEFAGIFEST